MDMKEIEVWIVMNEDGDYEVGQDRDATVEAHCANIGGETIRVVSLTVLMTPPADAQARVTVEDGRGQIITHID